MSAANALIDTYISETVEAIRSITTVSAQIESAIQLWETALSSGKKIIFCGNGGSAADAQHLSAELMGRFLIDRDPLPALSLTVDTSALTAIGNDYGYEYVFSRQLKGIGAEGDVLVGMSTSGNSKNVVQAFQVAQKMGIKTIALTGVSGGALAALADVLIAIPSRQTNHIQEAHITIGHLMCQAIEGDLCSPK